jgi:hypothetical protein
MNDDTSGPIAKATFVITVIMCLLYALAAFVLTR